MKTFFRSLMNALTETATLEEGIPLDAIPAGVCDPFEETLEERLIEVAFAEAADYDDIHKAIVNEHLRLCKTA